MTVGMMLDCGSGHSSIIWYSECQGVIRQLRRSKLRLPEGGNYKITDAFERAVPIAESAAAFVGALRAEIADARSGGIEQPDILYVGATGGLRNMLSDGRVAPAALREFETSLLDGLSGAFGGQKSVAKFGVISGEEEAAWELAAAELIYGDERNSMFSDAKVGGFGLFSGGGSSMQVQQAAGAPRSFPFSTWCGPEMDEELGADIHAWKDADKWERWEAGLLAKIVEAKESLAVELGRGSSSRAAFCSLQCATSQQRRPASLRRPLQQPRPSAASPPLSSSSVLARRSRLNLSSRGVTASTRLCLLGTLRSLHTTWQGSAPCISAGSSSCCRSSSTPTLRCLRRRPPTATAHASTVSGRCSYSPKRLRR